MMCAVSATQRAANGGDEQEDEDAVVVGRADHRAGGGL